jgi:hypothetical protein
MSVLNQRFEDHLDHHQGLTLMIMMMMMMTEMVFKTLVQYGHLTRLITREDYVKFSRRESSKTSKRNSFPGDKAAGS